MQANTTKVVKLSFLFLGAFVLIIYAFIKALQNQSGKDDVSDSSGCSSCEISHDADSVSECGCSENSGCSGCGGED